MNPFQRFAEGRTQIARGVAANHAGQNGQWSLLDPNRQLANLERLQLIIATGAERVMHEILNCGQHTRDHVGVLHRGSTGADLAQQQSRFLVNEKDLLDAIEQRVQHHDFGEGPAGAQGFEPPAQTTDGEAVGQALIERLNHAAERRRYRLANRRTHYGKEGIGQRLRVFANRTIERRSNGGSHGVGEFIVLARTNGNCRGQDVSDVLKLSLGIGEPGMHVGQLLFGRTEQQAGEDLCPLHPRAIAIQQGSHRSPYQARIRRSMLVPRRTSLTTRLLVREQTLRFQGSSGRRSAGPPTR